MHDRQRRTRSLILLAAIAIVILWFSIGQRIMLVFGQGLPGYARQAPAGNYAQLDWKQLHKGDWDYGSKPSLTDSVKRLEGQLVTVHGFLLPLHVPGVSAQFFLSQSPGSCYFCNPPGVAEVVLVNIRGGQQITPTDWPVNVYGRLKVATGAPTDQVLYEVNDAVMVARLR